jgi:hypothetical protein
MLLFTGLLLRNIRAMGNDINTPQKTLVDNSCSVTLMGLMPVHTAMVSS